MSSSASKLNQHFPHHLHPSVAVAPDSVHGALPFLKPTYANLEHEENGTVTWRSRDLRKGRLRDLAAPPEMHQEVRQRSFVNKIGRVFFVWEYWNISWWVAMGYTTGSVVWVINGFQSFLPFVTSTTKDPDGAGWSAWVGATIFAFASWLLIWEAWNRGDDAYFGWGLRQALSHHHRSHVEKVDNYRNYEDTESAPQGGDVPPNGAGPAPRKWVWFTTNPKYWTELGFLAGFVQLWAATIFWISGWTGLPVVQHTIVNTTSMLHGVYWTPQVIGGCGFIISSLLYMLEAQHKWWKPAFTEIGWHIGFWNLIGGVGFTLCGIFGYFTSSGLEYQSALSTFWGGWAFLIGSFIQWYEVVNPVAPEPSAGAGAGQGANAGSGTEKQNVQTTESAERLRQDQNGGVSNPTSNGGSPGVTSAESV